jgi:F420-dependent methylenetetrahydromethanopterin dehydrogenase
MKSLDIIQDEIEWLITKIKSDEQLTLNELKQIKKDLVKFENYELVFGILKPMISLYVLENPYEKTEDYILSVLDTTKHITRDQYMAIKEMMECLL